MIGSRHTPVRGHRGADVEPVHVTIHDSARTFRLKLAGRFSDRDVSEVECCWKTAASTIAGRNFEVDLSAVTSIDPAAVELLARMQAAGGRLVTRTPEMARVVKAIAGGTFSWPSPASESGS